MSRKTLGGRRATYGAAAVALITIGGLVSTANAAPPAITSLEGASGPLSGGVGVVTIKGTDLKDVSKVWFGAKEAAGFIVKSDTLILATAPAAATAGKVDVTFGASAGGATAETTDDYEYTPAPVITSTALSTDKKDLILTGTQLLGTTLVVVGDTPVKVDVKNKPAATTTVTIKAPAALKGGSYTVTAISPKGSGSLANGYGALPVVSKVVALEKASGKDVPVASYSENGGAGAATGTVRLLGTGFTGLKSVSFGKAETSRLVVVSDTEAHVEIPAKASGDAFDVKSASVKVAVKAKNHWGESAKGANFAYTGAPTVTSSDATGAQVNSATYTVTLTGTNLQGSKVFFGTTAGKVTAVSSTAVTVTAPKVTTASEVDIHVVTPVMAKGTKYTVPFKWVVTTGVPSKTGWTKP